MFEQYLRIKSEYPETLLFYRMGDFYELFFEDAVTAARELQITLTSRNPGPSRRCPWPGCPTMPPSLPGPASGKRLPGRHLRPDRGPETAKGLVKRAVTRVLTPEPRSRRPASRPRNTTIWPRCSGTEGAGGGCAGGFFQGEWSGLFSRDETRLCSGPSRCLPASCYCPTPWSRPGR